MDTNTQDQNLQEETWSDYDELPSCDPIGDVEPVKSSQVESSIKCCNLKENHVMVPSFIHNIKVCKVCDQKIS